MRVLYFAAVCWLLAMPAMGAGLSGTAQADGKPVQYAVVWLDAPGATPLVQTERVVVDQQNLAFDPRVMAVRVGTTVTFPNNDKVFHNVFSFRDGKKFDLGMYPAGIQAHPLRSPG
jgi:plastocyanin